MPQDTGRQLRSLYEPQGGVGRVFSSKVADYTAARPDYPAQLLETLASHCNLDGTSMIADVGAGTGLLARGFLRRGYRVVPEFDQPWLRELIRPPFRIVYRIDGERVRVVRVWRTERLMADLAGRPADRARLTAHPQRSVDFGRGRA